MGMQPTGKQFLADAGFALQQHRQFGFSHHAELVEQLGEDWAVAQNHARRLVTLLADGSSVVIAKRFILERLQRHITALEDEGASVVLLMCTGEFPAFAHRVPLILPQRPLYGIVQGLAEGGRVASLTPLPSQVEQARRKWASLGVPDAIVLPADPYGSDPRAVVAAAAAEAQAQGATVLFGDCFGYDAGMGAAARRVFAGSVVIARSMAARLAAEVAG